MKGIKSASIVLGVVSIICVCKYINSKIKAKKKQEHVCDSLCSKCACADICGCRKDVKVQKDAVDDVDAIYNDILKDKMEFDKSQTTMKDAVDDIEDITRILDSKSESNKTKIEVDISDVEYHRSEVKPIITADRREQEDEGVLIRSNQFGEETGTMSFGESTDNMVFGEDDDIEGSENSYEEVDMDIDELQLK